MSWLLVQGSRILRGEAAPVSHDEPVHRKRPAISLVAYFIKYHRALGRGIRR